ncbi:hypothetical protein AAHK14_03830 [Moraxella sp. K1664]|uniref:Uncharacterized protein n=1 Tax=Moraxella lacunata TaxID=477 RepID=A0A1B8Q521_MORLA|nr:MULTISPECIES: hypothetical protein [Moraxella]MBE9577843.1 hypothetical protein [Moraxella sp. K1664]MDH9218125.1 hypothetical protein [Moraxella lacunata]MDI4481882.1 hypothetical protein [Moraxella lacunata]MDI4506490.1 hypothetical protein [Moraxella lacunata]OBX64398.1 hypothetical protein A9Z63_03290 [Moraxella lacunata]
MAIIQYSVTQSGFLLDNQYLSQDLNGLTGESWYPFSNAQNSRVSDGLAYRLTNHLPITTDPRTIKHIIAKSYVDDFYHRIHIDNLQADLGVVASKQVINFALWNAYFEPLDFTRIDGLAVGAYFEPHDLPPLIFEALQERTWQLHILPDGDARLSLDLAWRFIGKHTKNAYQVASQLSGQRVIGFAWLIDWDKGVAESLAWHTDILQSQTGHEQRRSLRLAPRQTLDVNLLLHGQERTLFDLAVTAWASKNFVVPVWFYQAYLTTKINSQSRVILCDTTQIPYANFQYVMLIKDAFNYEVSEVGAVNDGQIVLKRPLQNAWERGTQIFPALSAQLNGLPRLTKHSSQVMRTAVSLQAVDGVNLPDPVKPDTFRGYPVLSIAPNEVDNLTHSYERLQQQLDNLSGRPLLVDSANASFSLFQYRWFLAGAEQHQEFYAWLHLLNGRQKAVWLPTFSGDLQLVNAISSGTRFDVANCGYTKFGQGQNGRQYIYIELHGGERLYRKIISSQELGATERLTVDESFLNNIATNQVKRMSFMSLCRLNSDTVNIVHHNDIQGLSTAEMTFRGIKEQENS